MYYLLLYADEIYNLDEFEGFFKYSIAPLIQNSR